MKSKCTIFLEKGVTYIRNIVKIIRLIFILLILWTITGCFNPSDTDELAVVGTENPNAEEILTANPEADIFQYNDVIYQTNIDWVDDVSLTKDKQIGEIKIKNETSTDFENETSTILPVGAKIFTTKEEDDMFLLVESDGKIYKYYALVEG